MKRFLSVLIASMFLVSAADAAEKTVKRRTADTKVDEKKSDAKMPRPKARMRSPKTPKPARRRQDEASTRRRPTSKVSIEHRRKVALPTFLYYQAQ